MSPESEGRQGARFGVRAAILGLIDHIPLGTIATRIIEDRWPSPRERELAAQVARLEAKNAELEDTLIGQREQIGELEYRTGWTNSPAGDRQRRLRDATRRRLGGGQD
jgi:hypothetical protein